MKIEIDDRETKDFIEDVKDLCKKKGWDFAVKRLDIADILIIGAYAFPIEIKRITKANHPFRTRSGRLITTNNDFVASFYDGRLYLQSQERRDHYLHSAMIIEIEKGASLTTSSFTRAHWISVEMSLEIDFMTHIYHTYSREETINKIEIIAEKIENGIRRVHPIFFKHADSTKEKQIRLLSALDLCSEKKAQILLERYGTPIEIFNKIVNNEPLGKGFGKKFIERNKAILDGKG